MSVKFELDNGEQKDYPTWYTIYSDAECRPEMPYRTKCGLSFKADPIWGKGACGHLECAIEVAKYEALLLPVLTCVFAIGYTAIEWYEHGYIYTSIQGHMAFVIIIFSIVSVLLSISPARSWLELREYKNKGTIHGIGARRL